jgi:hypothetical protein
VTKTGEQAQVRETKQYLLESKQGLGAAAVNHGEKNHQRRECESMRTGAASWLARDGETVSSDRIWWEKLIGVPAEETLDQQLKEKGFLGAETEQELDTSREWHEEKIQGAWRQQEEQLHTCVCLISKQIAWKWRCKTSYLAQKQRENGLHTWDLKINFSIEIQQDCNESVEVTALSSSFDWRLKMFLAHFYSIN